MNFLSIHDGHNASACLMVDGKIILALQEERFNEIKISQVIRIKVLNIV